MKQYEFSARNVQEAIVKGLRELNLNQEDVDIKVLGEGGIFSRARILIITNEKEEEPAPVKEVVKEVKVEKTEKPLPIKEKKPVKKEEPKQEELAKVEEKEDKKEVIGTAEQKVEEARQERVVNPALKERASVQFAMNLAEKLGAKVETTTLEDDENIYIEMNGENAGVLIGYRGEGLTGIQYLSSVVEAENQESKTRKRIILNVEHYKEKREDALVHLAERMAYKAIKTGRSQRLEPMNSYDRRIIHAALTNSQVNTYSKGEEPRRYLVIEPK